MRKWAFTCVNSEALHVFAIVNPSSRAGFLPCRSPEIGRLEGASTAMRNITPTTKRHVGNPENRIAI